MGIEFDKLTRMIASVALWLSPTGRRHITKVRTSPAAKTRPIPQLSHIRAQGMIPTEVCATAWYETIGNPASSPKTQTPTVVFVHGFTLSAQCWFHQTDYLAKHYPHIPTLLVDLRGHGKTGEVPAKHCTVDGAADDMLTIIEQRCPTGPLILVGHSLGGMIIMGMLRRSHNNLAGRVKGIVMVSSAAEPMSTEGIPQVLDSKIGTTFHNMLKEDPKESEQLRQDIGGLFAPMLAATIFQHDAIDYKLVELHAAMIKQTPMESIIGYYTELIEHSEHDSARYLSDIPGHIIVGEKDQVTPEQQARKLGALWPKSHVRVIAGCGHMAILERPDICNQALGDLIDNYYESLG